MGFLLFVLFLAVAEIATASKREASELLDQAELYKKDINSKKIYEEKRAGKNVLIFPEIDEERCTTEGTSQEEEWESIVFKFNNSKRYRRIAESFSELCLLDHGAHRPCNIFFQV